MIACYAYGAGLGHLTRVRAALHTLYPDEPATILSGSPFAADPRVTGGLPVVSPPDGFDADPGHAPGRGPDPGRASDPGEGRDRLTGWIGDTLAAMDPAVLLVDAFPAGLRGELTASVVPATTRVVHLARLLRWAAYQPLVPVSPLRFDQTWLVEPLSEPHRAHLERMSRSVAPLRLVEPPVVGGLPSGPGGWLVVHTGPAAEVLELIDYARDTAAIEGVRPRLTLVAPRRPAGLPADVAHLDVYPAWPLFGAAERIITAAGCNAVRQLAPWRSRHRMVPFPRRYDDQFARAARLRAAEGPVPGGLA